jgi:hypothetical protein
MDCCSAKWAGIWTPQTKRLPVPARLSRLLHCAKWSAELIRFYLWHRATERLTAWKDAGLDALAIWDESPWEKPESIVPEEL